MRIFTLAVAVAVTACSGGGSSPPGNGPKNDGRLGDGGFACADDSALEPNNSLQAAFPVPAGSTFTFAGLAICPQSDVDFYQVDIAAANKTLEVVTEAELDVPLSLSITNAGGTAIANGAPSGTRMVRASVPNLPAGSFFARVSSSAGQNNYKITVNVTP